MDIDETPEADVQEQATLADAHDAEPETPETQIEADEADVIEQSLTVPSGEDDYR